jgi:hypothetical protein
MTLHFVYTDIIFNNIYEIKYFMNDFKLIDQSVLYICVLIIMDHSFFKFDTIYFYIKIVKIVLKF